jgi:spore germination protein YaaH
VTEFSVTVSFGRAADEFGVAGYRVEANGAVVSTTAATTAVVAGLPCGTKLTLAARAFDAAGNRSVASPVANVRTRACSDVLEPIAPASLTASAVTSTSVALQWPPGSDPDGGLRGYVVARGGAELGRPIQTGFHVGNLAPATTYTFTVRSRDRAGRLSPGAASVTVTTSAPVPATGPLHAFLLASTDRSFQDAQAHYQQISVCYPTYYHVLGDDTLSGSDDPLITNWLRLRGIEVVPRVELSNRPLLHALLIDPAKRTRVATAIAARAAAHGYDGINLDFENGQIADRAFLTAFVQELATLLHEQGQTLSVDVRPKYRELATASQYFYDYNAIAAAADEVFVMAWDLHWSTSPAGAIADLVWVNRIMTYLDTLPNRDRYTVGTHFYGFDWPLGGTATPFEYPDIISLRDRVGATSQWDAASSEPYFTYTEAGLRHDVWYADADSVNARYAAIRQRGYAIGAWRLGREDPLIWTKESLQP